MTDNAGKQLNEKTQKNHKETQKMQNNQKYSIHKKVTTKRNRNHQKDTKHLDGDAK